jgi:hypothetical protein
MDFGKTYHICDYTTPPVQNVFSGGCASNRVGSGRSDGDKQYPAHPCMKIKTENIDGKSCREICATCCADCAETCCVICCCPAIKQVKKSKVVITDQPGGKYSVTGNYVVSTDNTKTYNLPTSCDGVFYRA